MKQRLSLSLERSTAAYLTERARAETRGNVSALVNRIVRDMQLADAAKKAAEWYAVNPGFVEDAERERYQSGAG